MRNKPSSCSGCVIECHGSDFSQVEGLCTLGIMLIAEASGEAEQRDQLPLRPYAPSGAILERTLRRLGYSRDQFALTNIIRCRPRENFLDGAPWENDAISHCNNNLLQAISKYKPKVIVALGNLSFRTLTGVSGTKQTVSHMRGYVFRALPEFCAAAGIRDLLVVPTFHPAFLRRGAIHLAGVLARDIQRAVNIRAGKDRSFILDLPKFEQAAGGAIESGFDPFASEEVSAATQAEAESWLKQWNLRYILKPTRADLDKFCRDVKQRSDAWQGLSAAEQEASLLALSFDLETYESASLDEDESDGFSDTRIRLIQFSIEPGQGIALDWADPEHRQAARWLLKLALPKVTHNGYLFDCRVLRAVGRRDFGDGGYLLPSGPMHDTMTAFRYWQPDLPSHLQFASSFACLASNARIRLWNGKSEKINNIVTKKMNVELLGMDEQGNPTPLKIINWFRADSPNQKWLKITVNNTNQSIFCTPDHKIWTLNGWKLASDIGLEDRVVIEKYGHNSLLHGTILGDGSVTKQGRLDLSHCEAQLDYLLAKCKSLAPCKVQRRPNRAMAKDRFNYRIGCSIGTYWKRTFYPKGKKIFIAPPDMAALAIWYCDDGTVSPHTSNGKYYNARICAAGFSDVCKDRILEWIKNLVGHDQVSWRSHAATKLGGFCERDTICMNKKGSWKFWTLIASFVPPSMYRKLPPELRGQYNGWLDKLTFQHQQVASIDEWKPERKDGSKHVRYCVEVDHPTHRYFTLGGLVSNSFPFPWKHLAGANLELYGLADTDSTLRLYHVLRRTMADRGIWSDTQQPSRQAAGYVAMVEQVRPILEAMELRGFPVDDVKRLALDKEFEIAQREAMVELDARFPGACRRVTPREKGQVKGYADVPAEVKALLERIRPSVVPRFMELTEEVPAKQRKKKDGTVEDVAASTKVTVLDAVGTKVTKKFRDEQVKAAFRARWDNLTATDLAEVAAVRFFEKPDEDDLGRPVTKQVNAAGDTVWVAAAEDGAEGVEEIPGDSYRYEIRTVGQQKLDDGRETAGRQAWVRVYQFSPNSTMQLQSYMVFRGHKVPTKKTGENTTGKADLVRLATKHKDNFYTKVIECRELGKARGTFINGFKPGADGRVHTTFTFATSTGQLTSRNPVNFQNVPKNGRLAKAIRGMFIDANGKLVVEWDFKSYHALTTGFCSRSAAYMRMSKLDIHTFLAWHFMKLPDADKLIEMPDEELKARFKWFKSDPKRKLVREKQAKPTCHGVNFGLGVNKMYEMNQESFESLGQARQMRELIERLFPEVFTWQERVRQQAHQQGYLKNRFGMIRWFYEVYAPDGRGGWKSGEQGEQALAFLPASEAFGNIRESMKELERRGLFDRWEGVSTVHDSLIFLVESDQLEQHMAEVYPVLHAPSKVLIDAELAPGGLVVDVECSASRVEDRSWAALEEVRIPDWVLAGLARPGAAG